jgi:hypothetical protein
LRWLERLSDESLMPHQRNLNVRVVTSVRFVHNLRVSNIAGVEGSTELARDCLLPIYSIPEIPLSFYRVEPDFVRS